MNVSLLNIGVGNVHAVRRCLLDIGCDVNIILDSESLPTDSPVVISGVGSFDHCIQQLRQTSFLSTLTNIITGGQQKVIGICLGMHIMAESSEEGTEIGIGYFPLKVKKMIPADKYPIPHIGWNRIWSKNHAPFDIPQEDLYYFSHQYAVQEHDEYTIASSKYNSYFSSMILKKQTLGIQFHPEKSYDAGKKLLSNFLYS